MMRVFANQRLAQIDRVGEKQQVNLCRTLVVFFSADEKRSKHSTRKCAKYNNTIVRQFVKMLLTVKNKTHDVYFRSNLTNP